MLPFRAAPWPPETQQGHVPRHSEGKEKESARSLHPACFLRRHWSLVAPGGCRLEGWQQGQVQGLDRWALLAPARGTRGPLAEGFRPWLPRPSLPEHP